MQNPTLHKMAKLLVHYSLDLRAGEVLRIAADVVALPLVRELTQVAIQAGAFVIPQLTDDAIDEIILRNGAEAQLTYLSPATLAGIEAATANLTIFATTNTKSTESVPHERITIQQRSYGPLRQRFNERVAAGQLRRAITIYPTEAYAQEAGMSLSEYADFLFAACLLHEADPVAAWQAQRHTQQRVIDFLSTCQHIRIVAPGTDLDYRCGGRTWINSAGNVNMPDGEVYTAPIEDSVQGHITVAFPSAGMAGIQLRFEQGRVVQATAAQGQDSFDALLTTDDGARTVGEVAFGMNYGLQRPTGQAIFDEKIGGTMHLALGRSLPGTGGVNQSTIHHDLVCDLREGEVYADGKLCYRAGRFLG